jgi:hypothetical protein
MPDKSRPPGGFELLKVGFNSRQPPPRRLCKSTVLLGTVPASDKYPRWEVDYFSKSTSRSRANSACSRILLVVSGLSSVSFASSCARMRTATC